jgi:acylphosphatase
MSDIAKRLIFRGHVQGVGLRYTTCRIALQYPITGTVRNLPDGSVEAIMQGAEADILACLAEIQQYFRSYIRDINASPMVVNPDLKSFEVTF